MRRKLLAAAICAALSGLGLVVIASPALADPLRSLASARGLIIGTAVDTAPLGNEAMYRTVLNREFNGVTPENAMKWDSTEPNPGQFNFAGADQVVNSAVANGQTIHGHTMVWHQQTPGWVQSLGATQLRAALQNHINTEMGRYAGKIESWDVVNEAFNDDGTRRASFWQNTLGANYITEAFQLARAADPAAKLCYNDFNIEGMNAKSNAVFSLVSSLKSQNLIDCLGIQGHLSIDFSFPGQVQQNIQRFANLGIDVKFTELDVRMTLPTSAAKLSTQSTFYTNVISACLAVPRCNQITFWGFTDKFSWVPGTFSNQGAALPFDENYNPKPAYNAINTALGGGTNTDTTPPTTPGTPTASNVTSSGASLAWAASTDAGGSGLAGYNVFQRQGTTDTLLVQTTTNSATLAGLAANTQFVIVVRARDGAGNLSTPSNAVTFTTAAAGGDTTPPTTPGTPTASNVTSSGASLAWAASTDAGGSGLAGYNVFQRQGTTDTLLVQTTTNSATLAGLAASTQFVIVVRARDGAGNLSTPSNAVTFTTSAGGGTTGPCKVTYSASNWGGGGGFTANLTLLNTGTTAINGWTLAFAFSGGQRLTAPGWSATWTQAAGSANVTAANLDWNRTLAPNGSTTFGFNGTFTGTANPAPTTFTVNGTACTTG